MNDVHWMHINYILSDLDCIGWYFNTSMYIYIYIYIYIEE